MAKEKECFEELYECKKKLLACLKMLQSISAVLGYSVDDDIYKDIKKLEEDIIAMEVDLEEETFPES